jgi:hypothetical protein
MPGQCKKTQSVNNLDNHFADVGKPITGDKNAVLIVDDYRAFVGWR